MVGKDLALKHYEKKLKSKPAKMGVEKKQTKNVSGKYNSAMTMENDTKKGVQMKRKGVSRFPKGKNDSNTPKSSIIGDIATNGISTEDDTAEEHKNPPKKQRRGADGMMAEISLLMPETDVCKLRPRKSVLSFRKVELDERDLERIVGKRVKVYWDGSRRWFSGLIKSFDDKSKLHRIYYDDGDKEELDLMKERIEIEVMGSEDFSLCSNIKKESSDGGEVSREVKKGISLNVEDVGAVKKHSRVLRKETVKSSLKAKPKPYKEKTSVDMDRDIKVSSILPKNSKNQVTDNDVKFVPYADDFVDDRKRKSVLNSRLRPRKSVPHFQKVEVNEKDFERIVGKRVKVYWSGSRRWFAGRISSFDRKRKLHKVFYDDGDKEDLDLKRERIEVELTGTEIFSLSLEPGSSHEKKESPKIKSKYENKARFKLREANTTKGKADIMAKDVKVNEHPENGKDEVVNVKSPKKQRRHAGREIPRALPSPSNLSNSKLRPRKLLPSFQKVELDERDFGSIVGKRVKVYWSGSRRWFIGRIKSYDGNKKLHSVLYDDGDKEELDLQGERFELEVMGDEAFNIYSKSGRKLDEVSKEMKEKKTSAKGCREIRV